ncbi:MAG: tetratricopeptide repeat protein [Candidatus Marinimicrobia bacterium]|nr:tetratricopeptide repeat protein [Candidatus Neomarinimicrobiota bacterium]
MKNLEILSSRINKFLSGGFTSLVQILALLLLFNLPQGKTNSSDKEYIQTVERAHRLFYIGEIDSVRMYGDFLIEKYPERSEGYRLICMYWISDNDWNKAIKWGKKAVKKDENSGMAHHWLGRAYGLKARNSSKFRAAFIVGNIREHFKRAAELMPEYIKTHEDLFSFYSGSPKIAGGSVEKAKEELEHIEKLDPYRGADMKANYFLSLGEYDLAEKEIEKAINLDSMNIANRWTKMYILKNINVMSSRKQLRIIHKMSPGDSLKIFYQLGLTYLSKGDSLQAGIDIYYRYLSSPVVKSSPTYVASFWRLGMIYEKAGDYSNAKAKYDESLKLNPNFNPAKRSLKKLIKLISSRKK